MTDRRTDFELRFERDTAAQALARETGHVKRKYWWKRFQKADAELRDRYWEAQLYGEAEAA